MGDGANRREFIKRGLLAVAAAGPLSAIGAAAQKKSSATTTLRRKGAPRKVIVLGAGLAGLAAAFELERAGHSVTVLEAQTRAGGRVRTLREPFSEGLYAEAGAQYVTASHAVTMRYVRMFGLRLRPVAPSKLPTIYSVRGKLIKTGGGAAARPSAWPLELTDEEGRLGPEGLMKKYVDPLLKELGEDVAGAEWPPERLKKYDEISFADLLRGRGASRDALALFEMGYLGINGDGIESFSALSGLRDLVLGHADAEYKIVGGSDLLPKAFAERLEKRISYGSPVVRIEHGAEGVAVVCTKAGTPVRITGDRLVCTLPFTLLRRVEVSPRFSREKERAVNETPLTSVVRTYMQTRRKVWLDARVSGEALVEEPKAWFAPLDHAGGRDVYEAFVTGAHARRLGGATEGARVRLALAEAAKIFPALRENFEGGASVDWDADQWARGAWTWYKPGQMISLLPRAARAEGRVHFAGEHTSAWPGWMQGALESGVRAAREVNDAA